MKITPNFNNFSPIPFYTNIDYQSHRRSYSYGNVFHLYASVNSLLPFQIIKEKGEINFQVLVYNFNDSYVADITKELKETGLLVIQADDFDILQYPANLPFVSALEEGLFYLVVTFGGIKWYSDVLTLVQNTEDFLTIEWWDDNSFIFDSGAISYEKGYKNKVFIKSEIGKPEYTFLEEGEERDGFFFAEKQLSEKIYKFTFLANEPLCDVLRFIRMSDNTIIKNRYNSFIVDSFLMSVSWEVQGDISSVSVEFQTNTVAKKIANWFNDSNYLGSFNTDFNTDFDNQLIY